MGARKNRQRARHPLSRRLPARGILLALRAPPAAGTQWTSPWRNAGLAHGETRDRLLERTAERQAGASELRCRPGFRAIRRAHSACGAVWHAAGTAHPGIVCEEMIGGTGRAP